MLVLLWACILLSCSKASIITINWDKNVTIPLTHTINTGDIVNWVWTDALPHGVKSTDSKFASSTIIVGLGYNYSVQFWGTGTFPYECLVHDTMSGTITVVTAAADPTPSPTIFSTEAPDLSTPFASPVVIQSGRALPAAWGVRIEVRSSRVVVNDDLSFNTRSFCVQEECRMIGPTIYLKAGDILTLEIENLLGDNSNSSDPSLPRPNTTRLYLHGLHTSPQDAFEEIRPGESKEFDISIASDHSTGIHWYSSDTPGAAELHAMNGLVGAIWVEPQRIDDVPFAIKNAASHIMVVTKLILVQEIDSRGGEVTQGCSASSTCNSSFQSPLCSGNESQSPYNPYRLYTMEELNTEAGSTLNIDMHHNVTVPEDLTLINGKLLPTVGIINKNPTIFRIVNAGTGGSLHLTLPTSAVSCSAAVIAVDGVYLQARWERSSVHLAPGSRVDVELFCDFTGTYTVYESGKPFFHARVTQSSSNKPPVKDQQLFDIRRPTYMNDLRIQNSSTLDRYFSVDMSLRGADSCSYQMGFGMNCLNETVRSEENSTFSQYDYDCTYVKWAGSLGFYPFDYTLSNRFITFVGALNQWEIFGDSTAFQTFTMRSNHFQIISMGYNVTENEWFQVGQYRDTLPMVTDSVVIRFTSADYAGEHTMQTNFIRHKELGVKESYLVVNYSTFQALTEFPTQAPTGTPNDGIIQTLSFQMAVAFGIVIILGVFAIAIYLTFFTESRNTVFPDKVI